MVRKACVCDEVWRSDGSEMKCWNDVRGDLNDVCSDDGVCGDDG